MDYVKLARAVAHAEADSVPSVRRREMSRGATKATEATEGCQAVAVYSRLLGDSVWLVEDERHADELERELAAEGDRRLVFTVGEVLAIEGMLRGDLEAVLAVKRHLPGARIDSITKKGRGTE